MKTIKYLLLVLGLSVSGCGGGSSLGNANSSSVPPSAAESNAADIDLLGGGGGGGRQENEKPSIVKASANLSQAEQVHTQTSRKIIRNAEIGLEAESPEDTQKRITGIVELKGGFVVESQQTSSDARLTTRDLVNMTIRVPAENFQSSLEEIKASAGRVVTETVKGQDVTEEFIDIEAQMNAKKALEAQFMEIMKRANTVEDALDVQRQLAEVRGEIERIEGRLRFLENQSALSTIKIRIQTPAALSSNTTGFTYRLTESFGDGVDMALNFILGLVTLVIGILPFALVVALPGFLIGRHLWRRQKQPMSVSDIAKEELKAE